MNDARVTSDALAPPSNDLGLPLDASGSAPDADVSPADTSVLDVGNSTDASQTNDEGMPVDNAMDMLLADAAPIQDAAPIADAMAPPIDAAALPIIGPYPEGPYGTAVGDVIADLSFLGVDEQPYRLSDMRREPNTRLLVIPVIATWCPNCVNKMPALGVLQTDVREAGALMTLSVIENDRFRPATHRDIALFSRAHDPPFTVVADPDRIMEPYFLNFGREKYLLIDAATMEIVRAGERLDIAELERRIREWLNTP